MTTPRFRPSRRFLDKYDVPCLIAEIKNSEVRGVASKYIAKIGEDPTCEIYLRGKDFEKMSPWMQAKLEQLFEQDGLAAAVAEGLKEFEGSFESLGEEMCHNIETHGYHPYVFVTNVVIDEITGTVLIRIDDVGLDFIHEHGGTIYLKKGRWHFAEAEHFINYSSKFDKHAIKPDRTKWDEIFPPPERGARAEKDCAFLYGRWESSDGETNTLRSQVGWDAINRSDCFYAISETRIEGFRCASERLVSSIKRIGNWITIRYMVGDYRAMIQFWCDGARLVEDDGTVYRRVGTSIPSPKIYSLDREIALPGNGRARCLVMDEGYSRLFVGRESAVDSVDQIGLDFYGVKHRVSGALITATDVRGFVWFPSFYGRLFCLEGSEDRISVVNRSFDTLYTSKTGKAPVTGLFLRVTNELYVFNAGDPSASAYAMDEKGDLEEGGSQMHTVPLPARPLGAACDNLNGLVYCSLEGRNEITVIDAKTHQVTASWPIAPGEIPCGLAVDSIFHRLFVNCANKQLLVLDSKSGKVITSIPVGEGAGVCAFDAESRLVFSVAGDGTLTIARLESPKKLTVLQTLKTEAKSHAIAIEPKNRRLFLIKNGLKTGAAILIYSAHDVGKK